MFAEILSEVISNITVVSGVLFAFGFAMMIAEFLTPGFGALGAGGAVMLIAFVAVTAKTVEQLIVLLLILFLVMSVMFLITVLFISKKKLPKLIRLDEAIEDSVVSGSIEDELLLTVGTVGLSVTPLRPCGRADFNGHESEVLTDGEYIDPGKIVTVKRIEKNGTIFVRLVNQSVK